MAQLDLIATMAFGLESVVADELSALGYKSKTLGNGRVLVRTEALAIARANLWLRAADRVLLRLGLFPAIDFGQLFDGVFGLPWEEWLPVDAAFPVKGRSVKSQLSSVPACQKIVKKAIVERLRHAHRVQTLPETGPQYTVEVALLQDEATLTIDTTGPGLNKRGYRTLVGDAQVKETLAAAMLKLCGWHEGQPLLDPFCGTGTIPIEAALIGRNMAPGFNRDFAAQHWPALDVRVWSAAREEARDLAKPALPDRLNGSDVDEGALRQARFHARQAGVEADIHFQPRNFTELSSSKRHGLLLCNPPYGERLATQREAELLYRAMPAVFSRLPGWSFGILTSHARLDNLVGRRSDRRRKLYNGRIECWFYQFMSEMADGRHAENLFRATDERALDRYRRLTTAAASSDRQDERTAQTERATPIAVVDPQASAHQLAMFGNRLTNRARHLRKWPQRGITCYRLYERDIPEIPLVMDRYEDCLHVVERPRPHDRTLNEHHRWLDGVMAAAASSLGIEPARFFLKRYSDRCPALAAASSATPTHVVAEAGVKYHVNLRDFLDTGLPLDLRLLRGMIGKQAVGKRVLSLYGNTGSLAVAAAASGAARTLMLDPMPVHVEWARRNLALNDCRDEAHQAGLAEPRELEAGGQEPFDIIILEDPAFAEQRGEQGASMFQKDHLHLVRAAESRLAPGGCLLLVTHDRRFRLAEDAWPDLFVREITAQTVPEDFRNRRAHRAWRMTRRR